MSEPLRNFWGWGLASQAFDGARRNNLKALIGMRLGKVDLQDVTPPTLEELSLPATRVKPPAALESICNTTTFERASHSYGKALRDVLRALDRNYKNAPDVIALPGTEEDIVRILEWCDREKLVAIPYGGGSSVTGGVEPPPGEHPPVVTIDLRNLGKVEEIDRLSRAARIQAGAYGPALEDQLRPHGLTLRHFPQSFEFSTLGGWIATRAGGHYATLHTHIDDFVEAVRVITPKGIIQTRRLPGSGAGPQPERLFIGSEGALGIITEAWMRLQDKPRFRAGASIKFPSYKAAVACVRELAQSNLYPTNCRLLDENEALMSGAAMGKESVLIVAFESADHSPEAAIQRALEICKSHGGKFPEGSGAVKTGEEGDREGAAGAWRRTFLEGPYLRDALVLSGAVVETFETAVTWDKFEEFHAGVVNSVTSALKRICGTGMVSCRFTHVYPDGAAPYYTVIGPGKTGSRLAQWDEIKAAASEAISRLGGTITHHHAVGRDHRRWYDSERPPLFAEALRAAKKALDPNGILNPGILVD